MMKWRMRGGGFTAEPTRGGALVDHPALVANTFALFSHSHLSKAKAKFLLVECVWMVEKEW